MTGNNPTFTFVTKPHTKIQRIIRDYGRNTGMNVNLSHFLHEGERFKRSKSSERNMFN